MRFPQYRGYGEMPSEEDLEKALFALAELQQSQDQLIAAFEAMKSRCGGVDSSLDALIAESNADSLRIKQDTDDFAKRGLISLATLIDEINGHEAANDLLVAKFVGADCSLEYTDGALRSKSTGEVIRLRGSLLEPDGGDGGGVTLPSGAIQAGLLGGKFPWWLLLLAGAGALYLWKQEKGAKGAKKGKQRVRKARRAVRHRRVRRARRRR